LSGKPFRGSIMAALLGLAGQCQGVVIAWNNE
jgi:hypothetical protein